MKHRRFTVKIPGALFLLLMVLPLVPTVAQDGLPLRQVTLFTSGVAEFVHHGTVGDDGTVNISIPRDRMADVVRSLTVIGTDGNPVRDITFPAGEDPHRLLGRFRLDLNDVFDMVALVNQARGAAVTLEYRTGKTVNGTVVGAWQSTDDTSASRILLQSDGKAITVSVAELSGLRFTDPALQREFTDAVSVLNGTAGPQAPQTLTIRMAGRTKNEDVTIRYLSESPVWRTSYRGVFDNSRLLLQGWAHIDNTGTTNWEEVTLALVSASPVTYLVDLYHPLYAQRSRAENGRLTAKAYAPAPAPVPELSRSRAEGFITDLDQGSVQINTTEQELVAGLAFTFSDPVSIPRGQSAMVPIVNRHFSAELVRSYDSRRDSEHPRLAVSFRNESGRQLPGGIVTVYDGNRYAGDAVLPVLFDGGQATLPYAVDLTHTIRRQTDTTPEELRQVTVVDGTLVEEHRLRRTTGYTVTTPGSGTAAPARTEPVRITHDIPSGWTIISPRPVRSDGREHEFLTTGGRLTVVEERLRQQRIALTSADREQLIAYSSNRLIDPTVRRIIQNVIELRSQLETHRRARENAEQAVAAIVSDQTRIRENMQPLERESTLYRRYLRELEMQENRLGLLRAELEDARSQEKTAEDALREYLRTL
ncbi:MAG: hypothetical protein WCY01_05100 [Alkalispirochaeta sp.]